jgi:hypothetical protein
MAALQKIAALLGQARQDLEQIHTQEGARHSPEDQRSSTKIELRIEIPQGADHRLIGWMFRVALIVAAATYVVHEIVKLLGW